MKNLLIFVNPAKKFIHNYETQVKMQIDNSLSLGWKEEDILLALNFDFEYRGVKAIVVDDNCYYGKRRRASKQTTICHLLDKGIIKDECWVHDCDAFQLRPFEKGEPGLEGKDIGFVSNIPSPHLIDWNGGSFFFKPSAKDVFDLIREDMYKHGYHDEQSITVMSRRNTNNIRDRYKMLNCTYNLTYVRNTEDFYDNAIKPIKVLHFNPVVNYDNFKFLIPNNLLLILRRYNYES